MPQRLFNEEREGYTEAGNQIARDFESELRYQLKAWEGFSIRDIETILHESVAMICAETRIINYNKRRAQ